MVVLIYMPPCFRNIVVHPQSKPHWHGELETGVTLMRVVPRMDAGPIVDSEVVSISMSDTGSDLRKKLSHACIPLIQRTMPNLLTGEFSENEQDEADATYCRNLPKRMVK